MHIYIYIYTYIYIYVYIHTNVCIYVYVGAAHSVHLPRIGVGACAVPSFAGVKQKRERKKDTHINI